MMVDWIAGVSWTGGGVPWMMIVLTGVGQYGPGQEAVTVDSFLIVERMSPVVGN